MRLTMRSVLDDRHSQKSAASKETNICQKRPMKATNLTPSPLSRLSAAILLYLASRLTVCSIWEGRNSQKSARY